MLSIVDSDTNTGYVDNLSVASMQARFMASNLLRKEKDKVIMKEHTTYVNNDFISKKFEEYTNLAFSNFLGNWHSDIINYQVNLEPT